MKKLSKLMAMLLVCAMFMGVVACGGNNDSEKQSGSASTSESNSESESGPVDERDFDEILYDAALGEFYEAYSAAKIENVDIAKRYALMALAEAKLMESGVMIPYSAQGGNYAITQVAPYTVPYTNWGSDDSRYHNVVVATELIKNEDRDALKALWAEKRGTGEYEAAAKAYLQEHGYTLKNTYSLGYTGDPDTYDAFQTSNATDNEVLVNTYDGLYEYDNEGTLQPALATGHQLSDDGLTYTFQIRQGVKWVDSTGAEVAEVTAQDFVSGFQHMLDDPELGLEWLVEGIVVGVAEYYDEYDASVLGIKATDTYTLEIKLEEPCSYFLTMLGYSVFAPLNASYFRAQGGKFGADAKAADYTTTYGTDKDHIAYCGPYIISSAVKENTFVFQKNAAYWNVENINIDTITWVYNDGEKATQGYEDWKAHKIDGTGLNASALELAKADNLFDNYVYVSSTNATSFPGFVNVYRRGLANYNDATALVTTMSADDLAKTNVATQNRNFRLALAFAIDQGAYQAASVGEDLKYTSLVNSYTPGTFVALPEETTVKINGEDKTYPAGTWYGQIMQDQIDADGYPMKVFDPEADGGIGSSGGYDGWYNVEAAKEYLNKAIAELDIEISAEHPVIIEYPFQDDGSVQTARVNALKQSVEAALENKVIIKLNPTTNRTEYLRASYYFTKGSEANYNLSLNSGWGPDYGDPSTYLDTMVKYGGYMIKCIGLEA